jgi:putative membrane protein insertion efficiency factor
MSSDAAYGVSPPEAPPSVLARALLLLIEAYRVALSPLLGGFCRFEPSCSRYAQEAVERHGALRGARLTVGRLLRCHPFRRGGFDPVP